MVHVRIAYAVRSNPLIEWTSKNLLRRLSAAAAPVKRRFQAAPLMMPNLGTSLSPFLLALAACTVSETGKINEANARMRRQVASTVTINIEAGSQRLYQPPGPFYYVCGRGVVNNPGLTDHELQRFITSVGYDGSGGLTIFDGRRDPKGRAEFEEQWLQDCN